ncbi:hypothetical protein [Mycobacterium colombiense]
MAAKPLADDAVLLDEPEQIDPEIREILYATGTRREPTNYDRAILRGLQGLRHVYQGTVDPATITQRRRRNKTARRSRRLNRKAA